MQHIDYVIGIDSGGTHYRLKAADLHGTVLGEYVGTPANHHQMSRQEMLDRIDRHVDALLAQFGGSRAEAQALVCGTTGLDSDEEGLMLQALYEGIAGFSCPMRIMNDAELAHYTVTGGEGILVICGTGSIAYGRNSAGQTARAGGWLFTIMGDEGSGAWISRMALRHLGRYFDGAVAQSPLVRLTRGRLDLESRNDLIELSRRMGTQPWFTPQLGQTVDEAAAQGDGTAIEILKTAAHHVFGVVEDLVVALQMDGEDSFKLGLWGSTILRSPALKRTFLELVHERYPHVEVRYADKQAVDGAVDLALSMCRAGGNCNADGCHR